MGAYMDSMVGDYLVPLFFVAGTAAMWFLAYKFWSAKGALFKHFGAGLALYGLGFAAWSVTVFTKSDIELWTTLGVIPFATAHIFFLMAATEKLKTSARTLVLCAGVGYLVALFFLRTFVFPSSPSFSDDGLFYFHAQPAVIALYILAFTLSLLPAITAVSQALKDKTLRIVSQVAFTILAVGGIILVTSYDDDLQTINGWVMGITWIVVLATYATKRIK